MKVDIYISLCDRILTDIASSAIPDRMTNPLKLRPVIINTDNQPGLSSHNLGT